MSQRVRKWIADWDLDYDERRATALVTVDGYDGWVAALSFRPQGGVIELAELRIYPGEGRPKELDSYPSTAPVPAGGVTHRMLRDLRLGEVQAVARKRLSKGIGGVPVFDGRWLDELRRTPRPGRRGRDPLFYAQAARDYEVALSKGLSMKDLAEQWHVGVPAARHILHEARHRKLLTAAPAGRSGGTTTPEAKRLLRENEES